MNISATVHNAFEDHQVMVDTDGNFKSISIASKEGGYGSSINGGELLMLALATCYCNDLYREAAKRQITIRDVKVFVTGAFGKEGEGGKKISYRAEVIADASDTLIKELLQATDKVAEIQNTLRNGTNVSFLS